MTTPPYPTPSSNPAPGHAAPVPAGRNTAGTVSLIAGIVLLAWGFVQTFWQAASIATAEPAEVGLTTFVNFIVQSVLALIALGFGIAGLVGSHPRKIAAGIGTGIGISAVAAAIGGALFPVLVGVFAG